MTNYRVSKGIKRMNKLSIGRLDLSRMRKEGLAKCKHNTCTLTKRGTSRLRKLKAMRKKFPQTGKASYWRR